MEESSVATLEVNIPDVDQWNAFQFENEEIQILKQPSLVFGQAKAAIGEKVHLTCLAASKHKLRYEWVKRAVRLDRIAKSPEVYLEPELVGLGCQLVDEVQDLGNPVSYYQYQCIIKCPTTQERVSSNT